MGFLNQLGLSLADPLVQLWQGFVNFIPGIIAALVVVIVGYLVGAILGYALKKILVKVKVDEYLIHKTHIDKVAGKFQLSAFAGLILKWYVFVLFLPSAADFTQLQSLSNFLYAVSLWVPQLIAALILGFLGFVAAGYVADRIVETKLKSADLIANIAKVAIMVFAIIIALEQAGLAISVATNSFLIVLAGIMLALGIGFGLALKDEAKHVISGIKKKA